MLALAALHDVGTIPLLIADLADEDQWNVAREAAGAPSVVLWLLSPYQEPSV